MGERDFSKSDLYEILGYLTNPDVAMVYDIQVPYRKWESFESKYLELTGERCPDPGHGSLGFSVLQENVDKYGVQYRFSYVKEGVVPKFLEEHSTKASSGRHRLSHADLVQEMLKNGIVLGHRPSREKVISKIEETHYVRFEFGYVSAMQNDVVEFSNFRKSFVSVENDSKGEFSLFEKSQKKTVLSRRIGRLAAFRHHVLATYKNQCCLCLDSLVDFSGHYETEAAHIVPKRCRGSDDIRNGLALCKKHHWAYDRGLFGVSSDYTVVVPDKVLLIPSNKSLAYYKSAQVQVPGPPLSPSPDALNWHIENIMCI